MSEHGEARPALVEPDERLLFIATLCASVVLWVALLLCGLGPWLLLAAALLWLANGLLIARMRSNAVEVTVEQYPELSQTLKETCQALGIDQVPALYLSPARGTLNIFTTRHACRPYLLLPANAVEAMGAKSAEMRFLLGHELGHFHTRHPLKLLLLLPGCFVPLIGSAYSRACMFSCDRHGEAAAKDADASARAALFQLLGHQPDSSVDLEAMASQQDRARGFFTTWHELASAQPTYARRLARLLSGKPARPKASPLAYPAALLTLSGFGSAFSSLIFSILTAAILFGLVLPIRQRIKERAEAREARLESQERLLSAKEVLLVNGTVDPRMIGVWKGGSPADNPKGDYLQWETARKRDGDLNTSFEQQSMGEKKHWAKHGQWRIYQGKYLEIYDTEKPREFQLLTVDPDKVTMTENPSDPEARITEIRQPGAP